MKKASYYNTEPTMYQRQKSLKRPARTQEQPLTLCLERQ